MTVLGISCFFHDSAACLIKDGQIIAAGAEERFSRKKHDNGFPQLAIEYCLQTARLAATEVDLVAFYEKPIWKFDRLLHQHLAHFPKSYQTFLDTTSSWVNQKLNIPRILKEELHYSGPINFVPHHLSHAASAYYLSGFTESAIVTLDGVGEWASTTIGKGKGDEISIDQEIRFPHSLGLLYSTLTAYLGFMVNNDEYKVMGLAAYGNPKRFQSELDNLITLHADGSYSLNMKYFDYDWSQHMPSPAMAELFGHPIRKKDSKIHKYHQDIAAATQAKLEETVLHLLTQVHQKYQVNNLCMAGGVALNSVLNGRIISETPFANIYVPPDPSDAGGAMGAALYSTLHSAQINSTNTHKSAQLEKQQLAANFVPYLGPNYQWHQVEQVLSQYNLKYEYYQDRAELLNYVSDLLIDKKVVGWFQGRMEWGPRALGNRSILAAATSSDMQDILNAKVKHREMFRPFAPVILEEYVDQYFEIDDPLPILTKFMLLVYSFKDKAKQEIPSVVHVNGSGRLQSIARSDNPLYYDLIEAYRKKTGIPVIINTSFNVRGEPIVCAPEDGVNCFLGTDIDVLVIDQFLVRKT